MNQLREALAIDRDTGCLKGDEKLPAEEILKSCSNLVIQDNNGQIVLAHHSVHQFLIERGPGFQLFSTGFELDTAQLELGQLCVAHLTSSDYTLALQPSGPSLNSTITLPSAGMQRLRGPIPSFLQFLLPKPTAAQISVRTRAWKPPPDSEIPPFFHFAKEQWAPLTHRIHKESKFWREFQKLALEPNLSWRLHPWAAVGNSLDSHYFGLLGWAIGNGHLPLLNILLDLEKDQPQKAIFNLPLNYYGNLPALHLASRKGGLKMVERLISRCDPKQKDDNGRIALHHAAEVGDPDVVALLVERKLRLNAKDDKGETALDIAATYGHEATVRVLVKLGANINAKNREGWTALYRAARNGHEGTVRVLVELGASINAKEGKGRTALHIAAQYGHEATVRVLVRLGADIEAEDVDGWTAPWWAAEGGYVAVVRLLLEKGAAIDSKDGSGRAPLWWAAGGGHEAVVRLLESYGAQSA